MKRKLFVITMAAVLLLAGCGGGAAKGGATANAPASGAPDMDYAENGGYWDMGTGGGDPAPAPEAPSETDMPQGGAEGGSVYQRPDAKLIRRATLEIQTEQFDQSMEALNKLVDSCGGYVENSNLYSGGRLDAYASRNGEFVVRVPAEKYSQFLSSAGELGYVTHKNESSEDVGQQYYDMETRLKTQRTKQERLLALLEKAETMEDIISLENALSNVEYEIEMYTSELNRYDGLISFSTFTVCLYEVGRVTQEVGETASLGQRMAAGFQSSLRGLGQGFQNFLIWLSYNVFLVVILAAAAVVAVIVGKRELKKRRKQNGPDSKAE